MLDSSVLDQLHWNVADESVLDYFDAVLVAFDPDNPSVLAEWIRLICPRYKTNTEEFTSFWNTQVAPKLQTLTSKNVAGVYIYTGTSGKILFITKNDTNINPYNEAALRLVYKLLDGQVIVDTGSDFSNGINFLTNEAYENGYMPALFIATDPNNLSQKELIDRVFSTWDGEYCTSFNNVA